MNQCLYCNQEAYYYCSCTIPNIYFCRSHQEEHENQLGDHKISKIKIEPRIPNQKSKQDLIQHILQIKHQTDIQLQILLKESAQFISKLNDLIKKGIYFKNLCDNIINEILSINSISAKSFYTPLESILLSTEIKKTLLLIKPPTIKFPDINTELFYIPSAFPHFLYNYSDISIEFLLKNTIQLYPTYKRIVNNRLDWRSRFLYVNNNQILFTGGELLKNDCFLMNLLNGEIKVYPSLCYGRYSHSMSWIENNPAVIGGTDGNFLLNSVEIFINGKWTEGAPINFHRCDHTSITTNGSTWIIGGFTNLCLDSVEKYEKNQWVVLNLKLLIPSRAIGILYIGNELILIGGINDSYEKIPNTYSINKINSTIKEENRLTIGANFYYNNCFINSIDNSILGTNLDNNIIKVTFMKKNLKTKLLKDKSKTKNKDLNKDKNIEIEPSRVYIESRNSSLSSLNDPNIIKPNSMNTNPGKSTMIAKKKIQKIDNKKKAFQKYPPRPFQKSSINENFIKPKSPSSSSSSSG